MNPLLLLALFAGGSGMSNMLLPLMLLGGGALGAASGGISSMLLPIMLLGGSNALSNPLTMMGLATNNTALTVAGAATSPKKKTYRRRRRRYGYNSALNWFAKGMMAGK